MKKKGSWRNYGVGGKRKGRESNILIIMTIIDNEDVVMVLIIEIKVVILMKMM